MTKTERVLTPEEEITKLKKKINMARSQLNNPMVMNSKDQQQKQLLYDQINEYNRKIEELTRTTRRIVPVINAPTVASRSAVSSKARRHRNGRFASL